MKRIIGAVLIGAAAASLASPAFAQDSNQDLTPLQEQDRQKKKEHQAVDQQYQRAVKGTTTGASATKLDPWTNMREPSDSKTKK